MLLPGADAPTTAEMAERVRGAVARAPIEGLDVRVSVGAATTAQGGTFRWDAMFSLADDALYEAKRGGRDRVAIAPAAPQPAAA